MRPRSSGWLPAAFVASLTLAPACADEADAPRAKPEIPTRDPAGEASARVERFVADPSWDELIDLLDRGHADARALLGPHRLRYEADFASYPAQLGPDAGVGAPLPPVKVDEPIFQAFAVHETLDLTWASGPGDPPRLRLDQRTGLDSGRELIILDEQSWSRIDNLGWMQAPLEGDLWQLWLDDAQHAARDLAVLAGPVAEVDVVEPIEVQGRSALRVSLRPSGPHPDRVAEALVPWRRDAVIELVAGEVVLDRATGLWLSAQLEVRWTHDVPARAGGSGRRQIEGHARLDGAVELLAEPPTLSPPADAKPLPERERPELLRERLLNR